MNNEIEAELKNLGVDIQSTRERLLKKEELLHKFLFKFLEDSSFEELKKSFEQKDMKSVQKHAHTLKGLAANLGLVPVFHSTDKIVEILRIHDEKVNPETEEQMKLIIEDLEKTYHQIKEILGRI